MRRKKRSRRATDQFNLEEAIPVVLDQRNCRANHRVPATALPTGDGLALALHQLSGQLVLIMGEGEFGFAPNPLGRQWNEFADCPAPENSVECLAGNGQNGVGIWKGEISKYDCLERNTDNPFLQAISAHVSTTLTLDVDNGVLGESVC